MSRSESQLTRRDKKRKGDADEISLGSTKSISQSPPVNLEDSKASTMSKDFSIKLVTVETSGKENQETDEKFGRILGVRNVLKLPKSRTIEVLREVAIIVYC